MRAIKVIEYKQGSGLAGKRVIALGLFDGVHIGHRAIIERAIERASGLAIPTAVFTFRDDLRLKGGVRIYGIDERLSLLSECGVDEVVLASFEQISGMTAEDFVLKTLVSELGCEVAVTGQDFRFGRGAAGDTTLLRSLMADSGRTVITADDVILHGKKVSSSDIKSLVISGRMKVAAELLGEPFFINGAVERGMGLGHSFGYPTLNMRMPTTQVSPPAGVYATITLIDGIEYRSLTNVGTCPTVGERPQHMETFILDFNRAIYGERVKLSFADYIREEKKFSSVDELKMQINIDIERAFGEKRGD